MAGREKSKAGKSAASNYFCCNAKPAVLWPQSVVLLLGGAGNAIEGA